MFKLKDYQLACVEAVLRDFDEGVQNSLVLKATGLGKTEVVIELVKRFIDFKKEERVLIVAQDIELVNQMYARFLQRMPELDGMQIGPRCYPAIGLERAHHVDSDARILIATRQTLAKDEGKRLMNVLSHGPFKLWIIDEGDLSITFEYDLIHNLLLAANEQMFCLGLTATSKRGDGAALSIRFDKISYEMDIRQGTMEGWLKEVEAHVIRADLGNELMDAASVENWMDIHFQYWKEFGGPQRHTLHFFPEILMAREYCRFLQERGYAAVHGDSYECIDLQGKTHKDYGTDYWTHRRKVIAQLREEAIYVTNKNLFSRGFDWRKCNMLVFSGSSQDATFTQRVGRGTRLPPGVFNLLPLPSDKAWRVQWENGKEDIVPEDKLPFFPKTVLLDFSNSEGFVETMGSLYGDLYYIAKKSKPEPKIEETEQPSLFSFEKPKPEAVNTVVKQRKLWRQMPVNWYQDGQGDCSTGFGNKIPYMIYITAPQIQLARRLYGDLQKMQLTLTDNDNPERFESLSTLYTAISRWTIWIIEGYLASWGSTVWDSPTPVHIPFNNIASQYSTLEFAHNGATAIVNQMIDVLKEKGFEVDTDLLRAYRRQSSPPTEKQMKKLNELISTSLPNAGWANPRIETPQTLTEAAQAINHYSGKALMIKYLRNLATGKVFLKWR